MPTDTIQDRAQQIVDEFAFFDDWMDKYEYLIDLGREAAPLDDLYKTEAHRIHGCQSNVWLHADTSDGRVVFTADSDALITKGLVSLLVRVLSDQPAPAIATANLDFLDAIGLHDHLTATRKNGLAAMVKRMKQIALAHSETARN